METIVNTKQINKRNKKTSAFEKTLRKLCQLKEEEMAQIKKPALRAIAEGFRGFRDIKSFYFRLLNHLHQQNCKKLLNKPEYIYALTNIAYYSCDAINEIETWKRNSPFAEKQFQSLVRHLFVKYEIPLFFDKVWFGEDNHCHIQWYFQVAGGQNIRNCWGLPFEMNKKMSHFFMKAPTKLEVVEAMKWAKVMACGGDEKLALQIVKTDLDCHHGMTNEFWQLIIRFLSNNDQIPNDKIREVFDFLGHHKKQQADYSLKGRTVASLIRMSDEWHTIFGRRENEQVVEEKKAEVKMIRWNKSGIKDGVYRTKERGKRVRYEVIELLDSDLLRVEGERMRHCVGGYAESCQLKQTAIFSIRRGPKSLATIEIRLSEYKVIQARAACNERISRITEFILNRWVTDNDLILSESAL